MYELVDKHRHHRPVVVVVMDREICDNVDYETVRTRYLDALRQTAGVIPSLLPFGLKANEVASALARVDGLLLTRAMSNVSPALYDGDIRVAGRHDLARERTVMAAIKAELAIGLPLLGICRGLQELNVALGGTLDPAVSDGPDRLNHSEDLSLPRDRQYEPVHELKIIGTGYLAECILRAALGRIRVNSLHAQEIANVSPALSIDACASDDVIEAVSVKQARSFARAVQWHPKWLHSIDSLNQTIFQSFGNACVLRQKDREASS